MKNILTLLMCFVLIGGTAFAKINKAESTAPVKNQMIPLSSPNMDFEKNESSIKGLYTPKNGSSLQNNHSLIHKFNFAGRNHTGNSSPIIFNSEDGKTYMVALDLLYPNGSPEASNMMVFTSEDFGTSWSQPQIYAAGGVAPTSNALDIALPSIGFTYVNGKPFTLLHAASINTTTFQFNGAKYIIDPTGLPNEVQIQNLYQEIKNDNGENQFFATQNSVTNVDPENGGIYFAGMMNPIDSTSQYGYYGVAPFTIKNNALLGFKSPHIPKQFYTDVFDIGSSKSSSANGRMVLGVDDNNNLYSVVNNTFAGSPNKRRVGFSKSEDGGATWSEFIIAPDKIYDQYIIDNDIPSDGGIVFAGFSSYYAQNASIVVTGEDQFSYFTAAWANLIDPDNDGQVNDGDVQIHILEFTYDKGNWKINQVGKIMGEDKMVYHFERMPLMRNSVNARWSMAVDYQVFTTIEEKFDIDFEVTRALVPVENNLGLEIDAALTADGSSIVVKWIGLNDNPITLDEPYTFYKGIINDQQLVDTIAVETSEWRVNDIYIASRKIDGGAWKTVNVTNDNLNYRFTRMPNIIPDLQNIPLVATMNTRNPALNVPRASTGGIIKMPEAVFQTFYYPFMTEEWGFNFNVLSASVEDDVVISNLDLKVSPNPAISSNVTISFTIETPVRTTITLSDAMGRQIETIMDREMLSGSQARTLNIDNLGSGAYYITLTVGDRSITKLLNITK